MLFGKRKLKEDIQRTEELAELSRMILQCIRDEGGNEGTIGRIIKDIKGHRQFVTPFVRKAIGPIWELAKQERALNSIDLATPIDPRDERVRVLPSVLEARWEPIQESLALPVTYSLWHHYRPQSVSSIEDLHFNNGRQVATLQELYWYVRGYEHWLGHCRIIAAGSQSYEKEKQWDDDTRLGQSSFPVAYVDDGKIVIDKTRVPEDISEDCFGPEHFYLVSNTRPDLKSYSSLIFGSCP